MIGPEEIAKAGETLQKYKAGKASLDKRIVDNELWFRMGHWKNCENKMMEGKPKPSSGWLFNSIANKHADAMDNYPEPNVLPRAADDEETAKALSKIIPVVLEQCDYEQVYSDTWWRKPISYLFPNWRIWINNSSLETIPPRPTQSSFEAPCER